MKSHSSAQILIKMHKLLICKNDVDLIENKSKLLTEPLCGFMNAYLCITFLTETTSSRNESQSIQPFCVCSHM